jgi:hypothetical protein
MVIWIPDTFPLNYSYTFLEEARKVPQAAAFRSIHSLREVPQTAVFGHSTAVCGQVEEDMRASSI